MGENGKGLREDKCNGREENKYEECETGKGLRKKSIRAAGTQAGHSSSGLCGPPIWTG